MTNTPTASRTAASTRVRAAAAAVKRRLVDGGLVVAGLAVVAILGSCGLVSSDVTKVSFDLPPQSYRFDTQQAGWKTTAATTFSTVPSVACADDAGCCSAAVMAQGLDCSSIICDPVSATCAFAVTVDAPPQQVDLQQSVPSSLRSQSVLDISVSQITYDVTENTMNIDLPQVQLFIADASATSADDPSAVLFGTVPVIPKGKTSTGSQVMLAAGAMAAFTNIGHHLGTPFTFLARSRIVVPGQTPVPDGAIALTIKGRLAAQPSL